MYFSNDSPLLKLGDVPVAVHPSSLYLHSLGPGTSTGEYSLEKYIDDPIFRQQIDSGDVLHCRENLLGCLAASEHRLVDAAAHFRFALDAAEAFRPQAH